MLKQRKVTENGAIRRIICGICIAASLLLHHAPAVAALVFAGFSAAAEPSDGFNDGIDRTDPNFVTASLLVASPGDRLYSSMGHTCFRLECPKFDLDYCFSYESESAKGRMLELLAGKLKMGMFAVPTAKYLEGFAHEGRGVIQYKLNLPPAVKQRLWKSLDGRVAEGSDLPYDVLRHGCAQSMVKTLRSVLAPLQMDIRNWPAKYSNTRRELVEAVVNDRPWTRLFLHTLSGMELDRDVSRFEKVVVPGDLLEFLQTARVGGEPIVIEKGVELLPLRSQLKSIPVTPVMVAVAVGISAVLDVFFKTSWLGMAFLLFQSLFGAALAYLVFISDLFGTNWNWLLVPFNLLPLVFWKWRQKWALWFAGVLVLWEAGMIAYPHRLTDPAYLVLVGAYIIFYLKFTSFGRVALLRNRTGRACRPATAGRVTRPA